MCVETNETKKRINQMLGKGLSFMKRCKCTVVNVGKYILGSEGGGGGGGEREVTKCSFAT